MFKIIISKEASSLQQLQDPSEINGISRNNVRLEISRHFMNKEKNYVKDKISELVMNSKSKNIRDLFEE
jgi:preprotein translocase subunit Sec63